MADAPGPKLSPVNDLKYMLLIFLGLWVIWFFTGGPSRYESHAGPLMKAPTLEKQGDIYGPDINIGGTISLTPLSSGVQGFIKSNPCVAGATRCNTTRPMDIVVTNKEGKSVRGLIIKKDGAFRIPLPAGNYIIWQKSHYSDVAQFQNPIIIKVKSFKYTTIQITFDNKIR